jgi:Fic family protein
VFEPNFTITPKIANALMRIEAARQAVADLPMTPKAQARLRETARLLSTHYSTQIEGNRLTLDEATRVIEQDEHFPGRQRDEQEVLGYYRALDELEKLASKKSKIAEKTVQTLHALVMGGKRGKVRLSPYRDGQNVIRDSRSGAMVYLPPEAKDVSELMADMLKWLEKSQKDRLPCPLRAAIAHYQFATIHPYYDGNGRTARLLTTLVLHLGGYDLKGFYSLEEYYARDLAAYYNAIAVGPSHNYYLGRADADITGWMEYFCTGMADAFESVQRRAKEESSAGKSDKSQRLRQLDARQRKVLDLFRRSEWITSAQVEKALGLTGRTARHLCQSWVEQEFLITADPSKKARKYGLNPGLSRFFDDR